MQFKVGDSVKVICQGSLTIYGEIAQESKINGYDWVVKFRGVAGEEYFLDYREKHIMENK
jgi:hypothetical protein